MVSGGRTKRYAGRRRSADRSGNDLSLPRGCFLSVFLCGLVVLGVAAYVLKLGGAARAWGVALAVVGTLLLLPFALVMGIGVLANFSADRAMRRQRKRDVTD